MTSGAIIAWSGNDSERIMKWLCGRLKRLYYIRQVMLHPRIWWDCVDLVEAVLPA